MAWESVFDTATLGEGLHTSLRKFCDSKITTEAWVIINKDVSTDSWASYLKHLTSEFKRIKKPKNATAFATIIKQLTETWVPPKNGEVLKETFLKFSKHDWDGFTSPMWDFVIQR